jgi:hypothetical protein
VDMSVLCVLCVSLLMDDRLFRLILMVKFVFGLSIMALVYVGMLLLYIVILLFLQVGTFAGHTLPVTRLLSLADSDSFVSASCDGTLKVVVVVACRI